MRKMIITPLAIGVLLAAPSIADAQGRIGSHRVGGYNSHGKGSHYVGGHRRFHLFGHHNVHLFGHRRH